MAKKSKVIKGLDTEINVDHFRVTIFGSARIEKGDPRYRLVYKLAKNIAKQGIDVVTGGGPGLMDAASRGHHHGRKDASVHSIGLAIKLPHEQKDAKHLDVMKNFDRFSGRLDHFMMLSNAVVVAPGGIGTLLELFYTWQLVQVEHICDIPIILIGDMWPELIDWVKRWPLRRKLIGKNDLHMIYVVKNVKEAMHVINEAHAAFKRGHNVCTNIEKYRVV